MLELGETDPFARRIDNQLRKPVRVVGAFGVLGHNLVFWRRDWAGEAASRSYEIVAIMSDGRQHGI